MLAVVKKPRTNGALFEVSGSIPSEVLDFLKSRYGKNMSVVNDDGDETVDITTTDWYKKTKAQMTPGKSMRVYRSNAGLSQAALGEKLGGLSRQNISDMECGRRGISKDIAKKLAALFKLPVERFL